MDGHRQCTSQLSMTEGRGMIMRKHFTILIVVLLVSILSNVALSEVGLDCAVYYDYILMYTRRGLYTLVVSTYEEQAEELATYSYASLYYEYAKGMLALGLGDSEEAYPIDLSEAERIFAVLNRMYGKEFPNSDVLTTADNKRVADCEVVYAYVRARIAEKNGELETAVELYNEAKGFHDSVNRVFDLQKRIFEESNCNVERISDIVVESSSDALALSWKDERKTEEYVITYAPGNGGDSLTVTVTECSALLEELLPDTEYIVRLYDDKSELLQECTARTQYKAMKGDIVRESRASMVYCKSSEAKRFNLQELSKRKLLNETDRTEDGEHGILVNKGFSEGFYDYYLKINLSNQSKEKKSMDWMLILRLNNGGTFYVNGTSSAPTYGLQVASPFLISLTDLLAKAYEHNDSRWIQSAGTIDLYIDGMYTDEVAVALVID